MKHSTSYSQEYDLAPLLSALQTLRTNISDAFGLPIAEAEEIKRVVGIAILQEYQARNRMSPDWDETISNGAWSMLRPSSANRLDSCTHGFLVTCSELPRGRISYPLRKGLELLGRHLEHCQHQSKIGIALTDAYKPTDYKWNEYALRSAQQRGQCVMTILKTEKSLKVMPCPWN